MNRAEAGAADLEARRIVLSGQVQGVGFRPYIYRHARAHGLHGWVRNTSGRVEIHVQGRAPDLLRFIDSLVASAPPLARPVIDSVEAGDCIDTDAFSIGSSRADSDADIHVPADLFTCDDCLRELGDEHDRRYRYPFINCTQCGPRYTLIESLPYDRANTSMAAFELCGDCRAEYTDPADRRYHAEPVACARCGPGLTYACAGGADVQGNEAALAAAIAALAGGAIVAVKGIGGYHLVCDALDDAAVNRLRARKPRPHKPLAVMFPVQAGDSVAGLRPHLLPTDAELELLRSPARPIVLVRRKPGCALPEAIAPGLNEIGAMLPYSPLHHLLLQACGSPLVATSANVSGEPVLTDNAEVQARLAHVADAFLHHNRPVVRPADDPVLRVIDGLPRMLRPGRGLAPVEVELPFDVGAPLLAVGAHMKNTVAIAWGRRAVVSPHIGEMDSPRSLHTFEQCIADLQSLYQVRARRIVCDAHPGYTATRWARQQDLPVHPVYHHHAHAATAWFDARQRDGALRQMLVFTWDGVGLGPDGSLWGGEALLGRPGRWRRAARFRAFRLPGGDRAGREPWRSAAALCWENGLECALEQAADPLLRQFWQQGHNAPLTTAAGRLFDAAAALTGVCAEASFEGQGPMRLESLCTELPQADGVQAIELPLSCMEDTWVTDWAPLLPMLTDASRSVVERAAAFHASLAHALLQQALQLREDSGVETVGLAGGVFQNRVLTEQALALLRGSGFQVSLPLMMPVNDAGISFGQIVEYGFGGRDEE